MSEPEEITVLEIDPQDMSEGALRYAAQGCTEMTCMYHGGFNAELHRRGLPR
jgi:hypothetical protein